MDLSTQVLNMWPVFTLWKTLWFWLMLMKILGSYRDKVGLLFMPWTIIPMILKCSMKSNSFKLMIWNLLLTGQEDLLSSEVLNLYSPIKPIFTESLSLNSDTVYSSSISNGQEEENQYKLLKSTSLIWTVFWFQTTCTCQTWPFSQP